GSAGPEAFLPGSSAGSPGEVPSPAPVALREMAEEYRRSRSVADPPEENARTAAVMVGLETLSVRRLQRAERVDLVRHVERGTQPQDRHAELRCVHEHMATAVGLARCVCGVAIAATGWAGRPPHR